MATWLGELGSDFSRGKSRLLFRCELDLGPGHTEETLFTVGPDDSGEWMLLCRETEWSNDAYEAVAGGMGLAILSEHALRAGARRDLITLEVEGFPLQSSWQIVHPAGRRLSPLAAAFRDHLVAEAATPAPVTA